jgi:hypothetical protein
MSRNGICIRHKAQKPVGASRYATGQKRCQICEIFIPEPQPPECPDAGPEVCGEEPPPEDGADSGDDANGNGNDNDSGNGNGNGDGEDGSSGNGDGDDNEDGGGLAPVPPFG